MFRGIDNRIYFDVRSINPRSETKSRIWFEEIKNPRPSWERFRVNIYSVILFKVSLTNVKQENTPRREHMSTCDKTKLE